MKQTDYNHTPVMLKEAIRYLEPRPSQYFIDCTLGGAGYTLELAKRVGPEGRVIALDLDPKAIDNAKSQIASHKLQNIILVHDNFKNLSKIIAGLPAANLPKAGSATFLFKGGDKKESGQTAIFAGVVFDLGLSSAQLQDRSRGFSFLVDAPLDMGFARARMAADQKQMAANCQTEFIVNKYPEAELERIIKEYGEERFAHVIARAIAAARRKERIRRTGQLVEIIKSVVPKKYLYGKIHPATRTFQALRIATNDELNNLKQVLPQALKLLKPGGKIAVISFHSLEDRIVKRFFKSESRDCLCPANYPACRCLHQARLKILTTRVIRPSEIETADNPRARSARLRVAQRI